MTASSRSERRNRTNRGRALAGAAVSLGAAVGITVTMLALPLTPPDPVIGSRPAAEPIAAPAIPADDETTSPEADRPTLWVDGETPDESSSTTTTDTSTPEASTSTSAPSTSTTDSDSTTTSAQTPTETTTTGGSDAGGAGGGGRFTTLAPGTRLPTGAECAALVRPTAENVPENVPYNQTRGGPVSGTYLSTNGAIAANDYEARIDGDFVGTTDEIIQWAACKWGFDEDLVRAQTYAESSWYAGKLGDCGEQTVPETGGCSSVGLIQVRSAEQGDTHHPGVYPQAWHSTALNLDYGLAVMRLCFEGDERWLAQLGGYRAGDHHNCMGRWFSGGWADPGSLDYQARIDRILADRPWEGPWVGCPDWQSNNHCSR